MKWQKLTACFGLFSVNVIAHPHSFVDLKNHVVLDDTKLIAFQMQWTLDEIASAEIIYEVNSSNDKAKTQKAITAEMTQTAVESHYFSTLYDKTGQPIKFKIPPEKTAFQIQQNRIVFAITIPLATPIDLKNAPVIFSTYEPSYYIGMEYNHEQDLTINNPQCKATLIQPQVNQKLRLYASSLDKNQSPEDDTLGAQFAQKVEVKCD